MNMTEERRPIRRNAEIRVKVDPEMELAIADIAKSRGLPPATLAAVVLGEYVEAYRSRMALQTQAFMTLINSQSLNEAMERGMVEGISRLGPLIASGQLELRSEG